MSFLSVQEAVYDTLSNSAALTTLIGADNVHDHVEQDYDGFPYVTIGEDVFTENDTDDSNGHIVTCTVHTWSRKLGRKETKQIQEVIYGLFHKQNLSITGYNVVNIYQEDVQTMVDPDGITRHGVQTFNFNLVRL